MTASARETSADWITCSRCGRDATPEEMRVPPRVPRGWEGSLSDVPGYGPVCPGCQHAEWHPHCTSWLDSDGNRVAWRDGDGQSVVAPTIAAMPHEEWDMESWTECDYIDLTVSWIDHDDWPKEWRCPDCGGTEFDGVHRSYVQSGLKGSSFTVEIEELGDDDDG